MFSKKREQYASFFDLIVVGPIAKKLIETQTLKRLFRTIETLESQNISYDTLASYVNDGEKMNPQIRKEIQLVQDTIITLHSQEHNHDDIVRNKDYMQYLYEQLYSDHENVRLTALRALEATLKLERTELSQDRKILCDNNHFMGIVSKRLREMGQENILEKVDTKDPLWKEYIPIAKSMLVYGVAMFAISTVYAAKYNTILTKQHYKALALFVPYIAIVWSDKATKFGKRIVDQRLFRNMEKRVRSKSMRPAIDTPLKHNFVRQAAFLLCTVGPIIFFTPLEIALAPLVLCYCLDEVIKDL
jgi:hypothetical protein